MVLVSLVWMYGEDAGKVRPSGKQFELKWGGAKCLAPPHFNFSTQSKLSDVKVQLQRPGHLKDSPLCLPEAPLSRKKNINSEYKICGCMREYALGDAFGTVEEEIVGYSCNYSRDNEIMFQSKQD